MASIQARHRRVCAAAKPWTPFARAKMRGCDCEPTYYIVVREAGKLHRERVGKDRQTAERALRKIGAAVDEGAWAPQKTVAFDVWADRWIAGLQRKPNTIAGYKVTIAYAKAAFGSKHVRRLGVEDVKAFVGHIGSGRDTRKVSGSTRAKHVRVLGACLHSAQVAGYAGKNPVRELPSGERPQKRKREAGYFETEEIPRLFVELADTGAYRVLVEVALKTGMRQGELLALTWGDVDLIAGVLHVRRTFTDGNLGTPKNGEKREVFLTPDVVELLGRWWGECGQPGDNGLVMPGETPDGYINPQTLLRRVLYPAMERAGIDRVGPTGENRTFHSLRHTFAKVALENERPIYWLSKHLGHSSIDVTDKVYGHLERKTRQEAAQAMAGAFGV